MHLLQKILHVKTVYLRKYMRTCDLLRQADYQTINVLQLDLVEPQEYVKRENVATIVIYDFFRLLGF